MDPRTAADRTAVVHGRHEGEFWKPCPGTTRRYLCCGYRVLTPVIGCGMLCRYCILQTYFRHRCQVVFDNFNDLRDEVEHKLAAHRGVLRIGTGEFADSLFLERRFGVCRRISEILDPYPNVLVEYKTKTADIESLLPLERPDGTVAAFSLNTERMIARYEEGTAPLEERLRAMRRAEEAGFWVGVHFDPMFFYPGWEAEYRLTARRVFETLEDPGRIAWWSLGAFRSMPALKAYLRDRGSHLPLFAGEMIRGEDRKLRYFRPIRVELYRAMREEVDAHCPDTVLYLCMESPEVWEESGMKPRIPRGLKRYLDERAEEMLGIGEEVRSQKSGA